MMSEKQAKKFHTDDPSLPRSGTVTRHQYDSGTYLYSPYMAVPPTSDLGGR